MWREADLEAYVAGDYPSSWPEAEEGWDKVQGPTGLGEGGRTFSFCLLIQEDLLEEGSRSVQFFHAWRLAGGSSTEKPTRPAGAPSRARGLCGTVPTSVIR